MRKAVLGPACLLAACLAACQAPGQGATEFIARCSDGVLNGFEGDIDCGGGCALCNPGQGCHQGTDCTTGTCDAHVCAAAAPTCDDGLMNGAETDRDCGGGTCDACPAGGGCRAPSDCVSAECTQSVCVTPSTCGDAQLSPGETDLDCGGACSPCATGLKCKEPRDCLSATCGFGICRDPTCTDDVRNQDESDVDCGGGHCQACDDGLRCGRGEDCTSGRCDGGVCASCADHVRSGDETGVDCGGSCAPCADFQPCVKGSDCVSGRCTSESAGRMCTSCSDGQQNGDESDRDCGGACGPCSLGGHCGDKSDCGGGGICEGAVCCTPNLCGHCGVVAGETCNGLDEDCDGKTDEAAEIGAAPACGEQRGVCAGAKASCRGAGGWTCTASDLGAHDAAYETTETTCDGRDNDCDGQTDEGLLNACGTCGVAPTEVCDGKDNDCDGETDEGVKNRCGYCGLEPLEQCNGVDDDCDGQTDELAACAKCSAHPAPLRVAAAPDADSSVWFPEDNGLTAIGNEAFLVGGPYGDVQVYRLTDGNAATPIATVPCDWGVGIGNANGNPATFCANYTFSGHSWNLDTMTRTGAVIASTTGFSADYLGSARLVSHGAALDLFMALNGNVYRVDLAPPEVALTEVSTATLGYPSAAAWDVTFDALGRRHAVWTVFDSIGGKYGIGARVDNGAATLIAQDGGDINLRLLAAATGRVTLVIPNASYYPWRVLDRGATAWTEGSPAIPSDWGVGAIATSAFGHLMLLHVVDTDGNGSHASLLLSWAQPGGSWTTTTIRDLGTTVRSSYSWVRAVLDAAGRLHVIYLQSPADSGTAQEMEYLMVCPAVTCTGSACAPVTPGVDVPDPNPDPPPADVVINELVYDTPGGDTDVFVELAGPPGTSLQGYGLVGVNGMDGASYRTVALSGTIPASGYYLVVGNSASAALKAQAQLIADVDFQNGPDSIQLKAAGVVVDAVAYGTFGGTDVAAGEGTPEPGPAANAGAAIARTPDMQDTGSNAADFAVDATPTPGAKNL